MPQKWIYLLVCTYHGIVVEKTYDSQPGRIRRMRRTRYRWLQYVESREKKVRKWRQKAVDREKWVSVIMEDMVLRGPQGKILSN